MKIQLLPDLLPPPLEWRWTRVFAAFGLVFVLCAAVARLTGRVAEAPMAYTSAGLMFFAIGFWMRSRHLARQLQASIERSKEADGLATLGRATAGFAHELKNSVMVARGFADLARRDGENGKSEQLATHLGLLEGQTRQMTTDLESFLAVARGEPVTPRMRPLDAVLAELNRILAPLARIREVSLDVVVEPDLVREVQEPAFRQALLNLGLNAIEHAKSHVRLTAVNDATAIRVAFENDGATVPAEDAARIFEPFMSLRPGGFGLGLPQVKAATAGEGGTVTCEPLPEGGTRFELSLPRTAVLEAIPVTTGA